jgi:glycerophosphoryl diester phosphodiesterase
VSRRRPAADYPFFDFPGPLAFAHRGGARYAGNVGFENSMYAFARAVALGYRYLETDVHATADGTLLAFHDNTLDRVTDLAGRIAHLSYAEVQRARIGGRYPIPTLAEILDSWPSVRVNVDVKEATAIDPLVSVVQDMAAHDRVCVASFSPARIRVARARLGPRVATALGPVGVAGLRLLPLARLRSLLLSSDAPCLQVPLRLPGLPLVTSNFVARAHDLGKQVHVWTVDDAATMARLLDLGVDGLMTDRIDTLRTVLIERGQWHGSPQ